MLKLIQLRVLMATATALSVGCWADAALARQSEPLRLPAQPVGTFDQQEEGIPTAVAAAGGYAYMATACGVGCYGPLDVIDVSDPSRPVLRGTTPLSWGTAGIAAQGAFVYTTGYLANPNFLRALDVSDPARPFTAAAFTLAGVHPQAVAVEGKFAYMVDYGSDRIEVIDISDPVAGAFDPYMNTSPQSLPWAGGTATGAGPSSIAVRDGRAYVVNAVENSVEVLDVADPRRPVSLGRVSLGTGGTRGSSYSGIAVRDGYAYVADANANALRVVDVSNPAAPSVAATIAAGANPVAIALGTRYAFVANKASGTLQVFDVATPTAPVSLGTIPTGAGPNGVALDRHHAFVSNSWSRSLQVFDLGPEVAAPAPAPTPAPAPVPVPVPAQVGSFALVSGPLVAVARSGAVRFRVRCTGIGRCAGVARLSMAAGARRVRIGSASFAIAAGRTGTVAMRLNRAGRQRVRGARRTVSARLLLAGQASGRTVRTTAAIRLRRAR